MIKKLLICAIVVVSSIASAQERVQAHPTHFMALEALNLKAPQKIDLWAELVFIPIVFIST